MLNPHVLEDVSLCAIVRDEMINPAGGIEDFVRSTLPFVSAAVIVDTGSKDDTLNRLLALQSEYSHLKVFTNKFTDFASARNFALDKVETSLALVLDADERLFLEDFRKLAEVVALLKNQPKKLGINFVFWHIYPSANYDNRGGGHNPRLFRVLPQYRFKNSVACSSEYLQSQLGFYIQYTCIDANIEIKHFCPCRLSLADKRVYWYAGCVDKGAADNMAPSDMPNFHKWREFNPRRQQFA